MHFGLALLLIAILTIGTTIAFFTDIEAAVNSITTGKIQIDINEKVDGLTKNDIGVRAAGKSECYVRIRADIPTVTYKYTDSEGQGQDGSAWIIYPGNESGVNIAAWNTINEMSVFNNTRIRHGRYVCSMDPQRRRILVSVGNAESGGLCGVSDFSYLSRPDERREGRIAGRHYIRHADYTDCI